MSRRCTAHCALENKLSDALNTSNELIMISKRTPQAAGTLQKDTVRSAGTHRWAEHAVVQGDAPAPLAHTQAWRSTAALFLLTL